MAVDPQADVEVSAFDWVPSFARGKVRDLRVRWALEEAGIDYRERLLDAKAPRPADYLHDQPFGQVPVYRDGDVQLFESGAIVLHIGETSEALLPAEPAARARATCWVLAALNSIEPNLMELAAVDFFYKGQPWTVERRPMVIEAIRNRLTQLAAWLGDKDYLEGRFTAGDLIMASVLRILEESGLLADFPTLAAYVERCQARPAFQRALQAQLDAFVPETEAA